MDSINNINGLDLTEAKDIKKRGQKYTEEFSKKKKKMIFMTQIIKIV